MPRWKPSTEAERRAERIRAQRDRTILIINAAAMSCNLERSELCEAAHIDYQTFNRRMRAESDFRLPELCGIADVLKMDTATRAAMCGAKEKCRFEPGYRI